MAQVLGPLQPPELPESSSCILAAEQLHSGHWGSEGRVLTLLQHNAGPLKKDYLGSGTSEAHGDGLEQRTEAISISLVVMLRLSSSLFCIWHNHLSALRHSVFIPTMDGAPRESCIVLSPQKQPLFWHSRIRTFMAHLLTWKSWPSTFTETPGSCSVAMSCSCVPQCMEWFPLWANTAQGLGASGILHPSETHVLGP